MPHTLSFDLHDSSNTHAKQHAQHTDTTELLITNSALYAHSPETLMRKLLDAFVQHPAQGVTTLMNIRNALVSPLGLRQSSLGCPVSSLIAPQNGQEQLFDNHYPVLNQYLSDNSAEVLLGADDKHLRFRTIVRIEKRSNHELAFSMTTHVHCRNLFGNFYLHAIQKTHQDYIAPTMLRTAVEYMQP